MRFATGLQICLSSALCEKTAKGGGSATELTTNDVLAGLEPRTGRELAICGQMLEAGRDAPADADADMASRHWREPAGGLHGGRVTGSGKPKQGQVKDSVNRVDVTV